MVPIVDLGGIEDSIGERPFVRDARTRRFRERDFRKEAKAKAGAKWSALTTAQRRAEISRIRKRWVKENVGTVPKPTTYPEWLKRQSKEFQDEVLGKTKAQMWRSGRISIDKFVDRSGRILTIEELRRLEN